MKHFLSALLFGLVCVTAPAAAQSLKFDGMVTTDSKFDNFAISAVPSPVVSVGLGKDLSVDGVVLPSLLFDKKLENARPALGIGAVVRISKWDLAYATFKQEEGWAHYYGLVVRF